VDIYVSNKLSTLPIVAIESLGAFSGFNSWVSA